MPSILNIMVHLELFYEHPACNIFYNKELHAVHTVWKGPFVKDQVLKDILNDIIKVMELKKTPAVIADARLMQVIDEEDQEWIVKDWYQRAMAAGFRCEALIVSKTTFNELAIKQIAKQYDDSKVSTGYFQTYGEAAKWLSDQFAGT